MWSRLLLIALLLSSACTPPPDFSQQFDEHVPEPPTQADPLTIASGCDERIPIIIDALDEWFAAVPEIARAVTIVDAEATVRCEWSDDFRPTLGGQAEHGVIWLNVERIDEFDLNLRVIALHEFGHIFGAGHLGAGTVMSAIYWDAAEHLTKADIEAVRS